MAHFYIYTYKALVLPTKIIMRVTGLFKVKIDMKINYYKIYIINNNSNLR